jgi:CRP-like cAMP-binding protein
VSVEQRTIQVGGDLATALRGVALFDPLPDDGIAGLAAVGRWLEFRPGCYVVRQHDRTETFHVVTGGLVKLVVAAPSRNEILLCTTAPGEFIGDVGLVDHGPNAMSAVAIRPTTAIGLDRCVVHDLMARHPGLNQILLAAMARQIRRLTGLATELAFLGVDGRLASALLRLASCEPSSVESGAAGESTVDPIVLDLGLTQSDLAAMVGATRPVVNRALHRMVARGLIRMDGSAIALLDRPALQRRTSR